MFLTQPLSGLSQHIGYNAVGANTESQSGGTTRFKKVVLPVGGLVTSIDLYLITNNSAIAHGIFVGIWADDTSSPGILLTQATGSTSGTFFLDNVYRWLATPIAAYLPAGTYWLGYYVESISGSGVTVVYDTGGSDFSGTGGFLGDASLFTTALNSKSYSVRAAFTSC